MKLHEELVTDAATGEIRKETMYLTLDYGTKQWRKTKKSKLLAK